MKRPGVSPKAAALVVACVGLAVGLAIALVPTRPASTGSDGTVEGVVSIGPAQPVCRVGESCNLNMSGYSLTFTPSCGGLCTSLSRSVPLEADGSYSIALVSGKYIVSMGSCGWIGCSSALPRTISVSAGGTTLLNITIDTGIR